MSLPFFRRWTYALALPLALVAGAACNDGPDEAAPAPGVTQPVLATRADSAAMRVYEGLGGPAAWAALPYLRFDFGSENEGGRTVRRRHLWNRHAGDYRLEWTAGTDSNYVALFNVGTQEGQVYLNGTPVPAGRNEELVAQAYRGFINDTYWMLAPVKLMDDGVTRTYVADSSDADTDVLLLTFGDVGLTPGDRYWVYLNRDTGRMERWAFVLQGNPDAVPRAYDWTGYEEHQGPAGPVFIATRKEAVAGTSALLTDNVETPAEVAPELFTDPNPRLD